MMKRSNKKALWCGHTEGRDKRLYRVDTPLSINKIPYRNKLSVELLEANERLYRLRWEHQMRRGQS